MKRSSMSRENNSNLYHIRYRAEGMDEAYITVATTVAPKP
jgi:valyl-tRNA synthetase